MKEQRPVAFDFEIDRLTNSIQNVITGDSFDTVITLIAVNEQKLLKKDDWIFDWKKELNFIAMLRIKQYHIMEILKKYIPQIK